MKQNKKGEQPKPKKNVSLKQKKGKLKIEPKPKEPSKKKVTTRKSILDSAKYPSHFEVL